MSEIGARKNQLRIFFVEIWKLREVSLSLNFRMHENRSNVGLTASRKGNGKVRVVSIWFTDRIL